MLEMGSPSWTLSLANHGGTIVTPLPPDAGTDERGVWFGGQSRLVHQKEGTGGPPEAGIRGHEPPFVT